MKRTHACASLSILAIETVIKITTTDTARSIFPTDAASDDERRYFQLIDKAFKSAADQVFSNGQPSHAVYLLYKLLSGAEHSVKICTGTLARQLGGVQVYADKEIHDATIKFLQNGDAQLSIIIVGKPDVQEDGDVRQHPLLKAISESREPIKGSLSVWQGVDAADWDRFPHHFAVMDDKATRVEIDPDNAEAFANFGKKRLASALANICDGFRETSQLALHLPNS